MAVSESLLDSLVVKEVVSADFCIGLPDWCVCSECKIARETTMAASSSKRKENDPPLDHDPDFQIPSKRSKLSTKGKGDKKAKKRFEVAYSEEEMASLAKGYVPENTSRNTQWAVNVFVSWIEERNAKNPSDKCPEDFLEINHEDLSAFNRWICRFITEARRQDGTPYPGRTLYQLLAGILRFMRAVHPETPDFLSKKDWRFRDIHGTMDCVFRKLRQEGVGAEVKHTPLITELEENQLWESGVLGVDTPEKLQKAVFFYVGKIFCIRGGQEQRELKPSQFRRGSNPDSYTYVEYGSKNISGVHLNDKNKVVPVYANPSAGNRCLVRLLDLYLSKLPKMAFERELFYLRPKPAAPEDGSMPWYEAAPVGKEKLRKMVATMCEKAGIKEKKTNHSLRATGTTELYTKQVPEKLIQERTGHRSLEGLRVYERTSSVQQQAVSNLLTSDKGRSFGEEVTNLSSVQPHQPTSVPVSAGGQPVGYGNSLLPSQMLTVQQQQQQLVGMPFGGLFGPMSHCSLNISPKNFVVCVNYNPDSCSTVEKEFDSIVSELDT